MVFPSPNAAEGPVEAAAAPDAGLPRETAGAPLPSPPSPTASPAHPSAANDPFSLPERRAVLAASAPWLGALLNVLPGLGAGYLYQRRWRAWWITTLLGATGVLLGGLPPSLPAEAAVVDLRSLGLIALLLLAAVTALEAFLAARRARMR